MSRIAPSASKLSRALNTASRSSILEKQRYAGAALMPKYDELLRSRRKTSEQHTDSSRGLFTTHRPTPQPSIANRPKPLMQTFHSSSPSATPSTHLDAAVLPNIYDTAVAEALPAMPLLPDNYGAFHTPAADVSAPAGTIVASNPDVVVPGAPMAAIEGVALDGVELKFVHEVPLEPQQHEGSFLGDIWRGMVDDVLGPAKKTN